MYGKTLKQYPFLERLHNFKGNPNSQGILNWIIQILYYYYRKEHKNIKKTHIIEQILLSLSALLSLFTATCTSFVFLAAEFFQFLDTVHCEITHDFKRHKWSFVKYIVLFSGLKMVFSKLSRAKYHFLHK